MDILWKGAVSAEFRASPKLCGNCVFRQNFHTRKLGQITVFYAVNTTQGHFVYSRIAWRFCIDFEQKERNLARNIFESNCFKYFVFMHVRIYCFKGQSESSFKIVILSSYTCYELYIWLWLVASSLNFVDVFGFWSVKRT